ncbi:MAG TPA: DUF2795 domain-containing protein [Deltaproteobacteria bacterium]|nr:DUF2795 domain-containing protein [Deltaproteobacteria bacterium]HQI02556.1 DUF2795 domain-containing protein [Deltaproteobacteria bacterium]HQJ07713.1 DUF2795 domain-containing protein [Deltaproteobacteria bacterium]
MPTRPSEIKRYIEGVRYPASFYDLNYKARDNRAPDMIIDLINRLPKRRFRSREEVDEAITECTQ